MKVACVVVSLVVAMAGCGDDGDPLAVKLDSGVVVGAQQGTVRMWRGIPFAAPPVGDLRWRPPQPVEPWSAPRDAVEVGSACPQSASPFGSASDDEDCLYLNVWAPDGAKDLPVMVWIHGGAFVFGSGGEPYYEGKRLAESRGVIVVGINYRLATLGFLTLPALAAEDAAHPTSGNYGLDDQVAALGWVQRNIHAFGGDPAKVTVFGESAGGISTCLLYVSPRTSGLFRAAIAESGLCADDTLLQTRAEAEAMGARMATRLGCTGTGAAQLACLRGKTIAQLLAAQVGTPIADQLPGGPFYAPADDILVLPNVDGMTIPRGLREAFPAGGFEPRPLLLGSNKDEGTLFTSSLVAKSTTTDVDYRAAIGRRFGTGNVDAIVAHYPGASYPSLDRALADIAGDGLFVCPTRRAARGAVAVGAPVFQYSFEHAPDAPLVANSGVFHASEIPYVFGTGDVFPFEKIAPASQPLADHMGDLWTQFAISGAPGGDWPAFDTAADTLLVLDTQSAPRSHHKQALCDFWDALPPG